MKRTLFILFFAAGIGGAAEEGRTSATVAPQPRRRLDPTTNTVVVKPAPTSMPDHISGTTIMDKFVVSEPGLTYLLKRPRAAADPRGKFTLKDGGRFFGTGGKLFRVEVGFWTHIEIMADDDAFRGPQTSQRFDFLRVKW